jgi:outer membrane protein assembly factor BamB
MNAMLLLALSAPIIEPAAEVAQFRGPAGQGHFKAKNVPEKWSAKENVAWKADIPGLGWSSPVLSGGKVYLTAAVKDGGQMSLRALCLAAKSGKILWDEEVFRKKADYTHAKNSHASPTPIVAGGRVYVHFGHLGTACLNLKGKPVWKTEKLAWAPVHGNGGSPVLEEGLLIFSRDGASVREVVALDAKSGDLKWTAKRDVKVLQHFSFSTPLVITVAGRKLVISPGSNVVSAHDIKDGKEVWRVRYTGYSVIPRPVYAHGLVFIATSFNNAEALAIKPDGKGDVTETHVAWRTRRHAPHTPSMMVVGDELYMVSDSGFASCLDAKTGEERWTKRLGGGFSASPIFADGKIYFLSESGVATVVRPGKEYKEVARSEMGERALASMAAEDGALYIRTKERLYKIGKE